MVNNEADQILLVNLQHISLNFSVFAKTGRGSREFTKAPKNWVIMVL